MNIYFIAILIRMGEYEKTAKGFWEAENQDDAEYQALCDETHNTPLTREQYENNEEWWDDYMVYEIAGCVQLSDEHADMVRSINKWPINIMQG